MKSNTILLSLNEINFDFISFYIDKGMLPNFNKLFKIQKPIETTSEDEYHLLEPWIQWVSVNTGKSFSEHNIFRLGDIEDNPKLLQIFEEIEMKGYKVGAISPFNTNNKLKNPAFFIPDPWTNTIVSGNWLIKLLYKAIRQAVNDNASEKLNFVSLISLALGFLYSVPINRWSHYVKLIFRLKKPASKAIIFDSLLTDLFFKLSDKHNTDFSNLFLNAGAHIQHHYFFNSKAYKGSFTNPNWYCPTDYDPLLKILIEYDNTIGRILKKTNTKLLVATGLHKIY